MSWLDSLEQIRKKDWSDAPAPERRSTSRDVVMMAAYAAAASAMVPPPFDLVIVLPIHTAMVMTIGHIYGRKLSNAEAKRVVLELGAIGGLSFAGGAAIGMLKRLIPVVGGIVSMSGTFALTWAMGELATEYFKDPNKSRDELKRVFEEAMKEGKAAFSKEAADRFKRANPNPTPADVAPADAASKVEPAPSHPAPANPSAKEAEARDTESSRPKKRTL